MKVTETDYDLPYGLVRKAVFIALGIVALLLAANVLSYYQGY